MYSPGSVSQLPGVFGRFSFGILGLMAEVRSHLDLIFAVFVPGSQ